MNQSRHINFSTDDLTINDMGMPAAHYSSISFSRDGDEPSNDVSINGLETVVFTSDVPIPFFEIPKTSIQLIKNPGNTVIVSNLPSPSHSGVVKDRSGVLESEIYVFI